jgi:acyl carrier protein
MPALTREEILPTVTEIVAKVFGLPIEELSPELDLRQIEGVDSVKVLRAVATIEQRYDIELEDEDVFTLKSIDDLTTVIEKTL